MINAESRGCLPFCMEGGQGFFYNVLFECNGGSFQIVLIFGMGIGICVPDTKHQSYRFLVDNIILVDTNKTFCDIFQFTDIARPVVILQKMQGITVDLDGLVVFLGIFFEKMIKKDFDIRFSFPKGNELDRNNI